jgi:negative regulator of replication initiation
MTTLVQYSQEIAPKVRKLLELKDTLKEGVKDDAKVIELKEEIADINAQIKQHIEDNESQLVREIKDLETDIKLAIKAAAKGTDYKPAELKGFFEARAKEKVADVVDKGALFEQLESELA